MLVSTIGSIFPGYLKNAPEPVRVNFGQDVKTHHIEYINKKTGFL